MSTCAVPALMPSARAGPFTNTGMRNNGSNESKPGGFMQATPENWAALTILRRGPRRADVLGSGLGKRDCGTFLGCTDLGHTRRIAPVSFLHDRRQGNGLARQVRRFHTR